MNTASRMESNSEPSRINLSHAARRALFDQAPGVQAKSRGEVPIKGKAEPERCFWLVDSDENRSRCAATPPPEEVRRPDLDVLKRESQPGSLPVCPQCRSRRRPGHPGPHGRRSLEASPRLLNAAHSRSHRRLMAAALGMGSPLRSFEKGFR